MMWCVMFKKYLDYLTYNLLAWHLILCALNQKHPMKKDVRMINKFIHNVENETHFKFRIISGGNSSMLPQTLYNHLDKINDLRIGRHY